MVAKKGPLTISELINVWRSATDDGYNRPLAERGDGFGLEAIGQAAAQLARVSEAVDRSTQAMFILPWSGQTNEPAGGASKATVQITITRSERFDLALTFVKGQIFFEEEADEQSPDGTLPVATGRRYVVTRTDTLGPGEATLTLDTEAERPGYGYNNPREGTITVIVQPGTGFEGEGATVIAGDPVIGTRHRVVATTIPDVPIPRHVGQYLEMVSGANVGQIRRIVGYEAPQPTASPPTGGTFVLAPTLVITVSAFPSGTFVEGEEVTESGSGATGTLVGVTANALVIDRKVGTFVGAGSTITGVESGATATTATIVQSPTMTDETGSAAWRVLDWTDDLKVTASNPVSPDGGRPPWLDELGNERGLPRSPGEDDEKYRQRIAKLADTISPNAIKRAANRVLSTIGSSVCFREVGDVNGLFPGLFYDVVSPDPRFAYAYDLDFTIRPQDRFKLAMSIEESRAFFLIGVPPLNLGEFGIPYDAVSTPINFYDATPFLAFYDGFPVTAAIIYRNVWQAVDKIRAAGAGFDLYVERLGCF